ncbi:MAG: hypothetical protein EBT12_15730 [Marivivens sp.]|nr:hypothetical protein [Marivivens sp.]
MTDHLITPPPELKQQWREQAPRYRDGGVGRELWLIDRASQWGADQELEACRMEIIDGAGLLFIGETSDRVELADDLRNARRPKPPNLKDLALSELETILNELHRANGSILTASAIRRALKRLKQLEDSND